MASDCICKLLSGSFLPPGNLFPPSTYLVQRIADVESLDDVEYHTCDCLGHVYHRISKKEWKAHALDKCPVAGCGLSRFVSKKIGGNAPILTPRKVSLLVLVSYIGLFVC